MGLLARDVEYLDPSLVEPTVEAYRASEYMFLIVAILLVYDASGFALLLPIFLR